jgi:hypothetical protein
MGLTFRDHVQVQEREDASYMHDICILAHRQLSPTLYCPHMPVLFARLPCVQQLVLRAYLLHTCGQYMQSVREWVACSGTANQEQRTLSTTTFYPQTDQVISSGRPECTCSLSHMRNGISLSVLKNT